MNKTPLLDAIINIHDYCKGQNTDHRFNRNCESCMFYANHKNYMYKTCEIDCLITLLSGRPSEWDIGLIEEFMNE